VYVNSLTYSPSEVPTQSPTGVLPTVPTRSPTKSPTLIPTTPLTISPTVRNVEENCPETVGNLWTLVRHAPPGKNWHQATDNLIGTDEYGTPSGPTSLSYWSIKFDTTTFDKFLFTRDNCEKWLITSKEAVYGPDGNTYYGNALRTIISSSISSTSYAARWYRRSSKYTEDPWISVTDHHTALGTGEIVYGESSAPSPNYIDSANVYINSLAYSQSTTAATPLLSERNSSKSLSNNVYVITGLVTLVILIIVVSLMIKNKRKRATSVSHEIPHQVDFEQPTDVF